MKKIFAALLLITVLSISLLMGCSESQDSGTDAIDLVPQTANMIGYVALGQVIDDSDIAGIYEALPKEAGDPQTLEEALAMAMDMSGLDLSDFEECWVFSDVSQVAGDASYAGAILRGSFVEGDILASVKSAIGEEFSIIDYQGHEVYTDSGQEAGVAILTNDVVVAGSIEAVKDVIAVKEEDRPSVGGELVATYDGLDDALVKAAIAVPDGLVEQSLQEIDTGISLSAVIDPLSDLQTVGLTVAKDGESIVCNSQLLFGDSESAEAVNGLIQLVPLMMGSVEMPEGALTENQQRALVLLARLLDESDSSVTDSWLKVSFDLTVADIEAAFPEEHDDGQDGSDGSLSGLGVDMAVSMGSLSASGLNVAINGSISNHTAFAFEMGELKLTAASKTGRSYIQDTIIGNPVTADSTATFQHAMVIPLGLVDERELLITVDTRAGAAGIDIPLSASVALAIPAIESLVSVPEVDLAVCLGELTSDGLQVPLQASITNSNPFDIDVGDLQIVAKGQSGNVITTSDITGCSIGSNSTGKIAEDLLIPLEVLNESIIEITVQARAGFAGITLPVKAKAAVTLPDLGSLISIPDIESNVEVDIAPAFPLPGLKIAVTSTIANQSNLNLIVGDIQMSIFDSDGTLLARMAIPGGEIGTSSSHTFSGTVILSPSDYQSLLDGDNFSIELTTEVGISGVNAKIPIEVEITVV
jgi:hypothetical protein